MSSNRSRVRSSSVGINLNLIEYSPVALPEKKKSCTAATVSSTQSKAANSKVPAVSPPVKVSQAVPRETRRCIFTIGSPVREKQSDKKAHKVDEGFGMFLQACFRCKKKLKPDEDIFMFGYLRAFCSLDCRDDQIDLEYIGRSSERPITKVKEATKLREARAKRGFGLQERERLEVEYIGKATERQITKVMAATKFGEAPAKQGFGLQAKKRLEVARFK